MKKLLVFSALTAGSLFASAALADEPISPPCNGNFGITYPNRCTPTPPTPDIPDEAFAAAPDVVIEVAPIQAPVQEAQAPCVEASPVPPLYQPNRLSMTGNTQSKLGLFQNANRVREVGVRSLTGDGYGGSGYFRTHRNESRVGLELSIDGVDSVLLTQASLVGYSKHEGIIRPYAFVGGGLYIDVPGASFQTGVGADINITQRLTLNVDVRYLSANEIGGTTYYDCLDCFYDYEQSFDGGLVSMGLGWKFGALGKQQKTLLQGRLLGSVASAFNPTASTKKLTWAKPAAHSWSQGGLGWNQSKYVAAWNQPSTTKPGSFFQPKSKSNTFVREVGFRSFTDLDDGGNDTGGGLYAKTYRSGGRLGGEASLDAIGSDILAQASLIGYLNPKGTVRPYGILGVGTELTTSELTAQWGAGVDVAVSKHVSINADLRGLEGSGTYSTTDCDSSGFCYDSYDYLSAFVGGVGVGYRF